MFTASFWKDAVERSVKTAAQAVVLFLAADATGLDAVNADWAGAGSFAAGGFVLSLLTSVVSAPFGESGTASLVKAGVEEGPVE